MRNVVLGLLMSSLLLMAFGAAQAQGASDGSIRGTVYLDKNGDGKCVGTGEPVHVGTPIEFVSNDGKWTTYLQSGENGTYGLVAAGFGTWTVSARPNANDFVVTSKPSLSVFIGSEEPVAVGVDFCIQAIDGPRTAKTTHTTTTLPRSGAPAQDGGYWLTAVMGLLLLGAGAVLQKQRA